MSPTMAAVVGPALRTGQEVAEEAAQAQKRMVSQKGKAQLRAASSLV
jgi:hypothetical protein